MTTDLVAQLNNPVLISPSGERFSSVAWDKERAVIDPKYPQAPDLYEGLYWVRKILKNATELLIEGLDGELVEVHQDNAQLVD
jgi:hypothetical protein